MQHRAQGLQIRPRRAADGLITEVTPADAGWSHLSVQVRSLACRQRFATATGDCECVLVLLGGRCSITSTHGSWAQVGRRTDVFSGMPHAVYLPPRTDYELTATSDLEIAIGSATATEDHPPAWIKPGDVSVELRGGGHASRQINGIVPPGFPCQRLVCVEVFTPAGNWSSYPPHKHDVHRTNASGQLIEAKLEEIYYYKIRGRNGFAVQRVYTDDRSLDQTYTVGDDDIVLVPRGYHPVSAAVGYDCYYLNFLAGSAQSLACTDDPAHAWIKNSWPALDPRVPMVTMEMES